MRCADVAVLLAEQQTLPLATTLALSFHLHECRACRARAAYLAWLEGELAGLPRVTAPAALRPAVLARVGEGRVGVARGLRAGVVGFSAVASPVGPLLVAYGEAAIVRVAFGGISEADFAATLAGRRDPAVRRDGTPPAWVAAVVADHFAGRRLPATVFDLQGVPAFGRQVLLKALEIPWGEVRPYAWLAREIGRPGAARAVGQALGRNPVPVLIPCHRAVRSDGGLGGYAFGLALKERLLALERIR